MSPQQSRALRVFLSALVPAVLVSLTDWSAGVSIPIVAVAVGAINVAYRKSNPFEGTSQAWRFVRLFAFTMAPAVIAFTTDLTASLPALAAAPAILEVLFRQYVSNPDAGG